MATRGLNEVGSGRSRQDEAARPANRRPDAPGTDQAAS